MQSTIPGLFVIGEANFSDHGANRLGASALMQGLADGYFILPYTIQNYLSSEIQVPRMPVDLPEFKEADEQAQDRIKMFMGINGNTTVDTFHKRLGKIMWDNVGMARNRESLSKAIELIQEQREEYYKNVKVPGVSDDLNAELEKANRVADFLELGELMATDALHRDESCGGHFREEFRTDEGEAQRNDADFAYVAAWEYTGRNQKPNLVKEPLQFEAVELKQRNYKS